jgi:hypothetical protein
MSVNSVVLFNSHARCELLPPVAVEGLWVGSRTQIKALGKVFRFLAVGETFHFGIPSRIQNNRAHATVHLEYIFGAPCCAGGTGGMSVGQMGLLLSHAEQALFVIKNIAIALSFL